MAYRTGSATVLSASCRWQNTLRPAKRASGNHSGGVMVLTSTVLALVRLSSRQDGTHAVTASVRSWSSPPGVSRLLRMIGVGCSSTVAPASVNNSISGPGPGTVTTPDTRR